MKSDLQKHLDRISRMERIEQHSIKKIVLVDLKVLETRRWTIASYVGRCDVRRRAAFFKLRQVGGAHAVVEKRNERRRLETQWRLYIPDEDSIDFEHCAEPKTPKNMAIGMEFQVADARLRRAYVWLEVFTKALIWAIKEAAAGDKRKLPFSDGVTNYLINGRDYLFLREYSKFPHSQDPRIMLKFLCGPGPYNEVPYQEVDFSVWSPRKNTIRTGRTYTPEEILPLVGQSKPLFLEGDRTAIGGLRLHTFKAKGVKCVKCGIRGSLFYKEKEQRDAKRWILNLYAVDLNGKEVLMTRDHITPRSKGGLDKLKNLQTMCVRCNLKKADTVEGGKNGQHRKAHLDVGTDEGRGSDPAPKADGGQTSDQDHSDVRVAQDGH